MPYAPCTGYNSPIRNISTEWKSGDVKISKIEIQYVEAEIFERVNDS
jgi:hypothetical protein